MCYPTKFGENRELEQKSLVNNSPMDFRYPFEFRNENIFYSKILLSEIMSQKSQRSFRLEDKLRIQV